MRWFFCLFLAWTASAANLIPNSSFEVGHGRGWLSFGTGDSAFIGNLQPIRALLTNDQWHGAKSMILPTGARLQSRAIWLNAGTNTLSFYAKTLSGLQGPYHAGVMDGSNLAEVSPPSIGNITGSYARYTIGFQATSNAFYWVKFLNNGQPVILADGLQLETGTVATTYAPQSAVEMGITVDGTNNLYFAGDTPTFTLNFWNEGAAAAARANYQVFDLWNSNVMSATLNVTMAAATNASTTVVLTGRKGWLRIVSRLIAYNDSHDELTTIVYPFASNILTHATNDWLGGHPNASDFHTRRELLTGRKWARTLSPNYRNTRWWAPAPNTAESVEATRGNFSFIDSLITNQAAAGMNIIGTLTPLDGYWPEWATNANGTADLQAFSTYCSNVVNRFKTYIHTWEIGPNEPYQSGPTGFGPFDGNPTSDPYAGATNLPINVRVATNYAKALAAGVAGVTNADPTATIIGIAGAYGAGEWAWEVWTNLSADIQSWIDVVSTHIYPQDQGLDPNLSHYASIGFNQPFGWITTFNGIRPVWNTESGTYVNAGGTLKGLNALWPIQYNVHTVLPADAEALRSASSIRHFAATCEILNQALRCQGAGFDKYFYYDTRAFTDGTFTGLTPYAADYQQVDRPELAALSVATHFIRKGFGGVTNETALYSNLVEMYGFTNALGQAVMTAWAADRTNRVMTLSNSFFAVYDAMGNLVQTNVGTMRITRLAQYIVSGHLSLAQLTNTFKFCTMTNANDVLPPQVSFDIAPSGLWDGSTNATLVKWTGIDDTWTPWATNGVSAPSATNVVYKWKLDGGSYTGNSQSNHVWLHHLSSGNHTISVTATDKNGNAAEYSYEFVPPTSVLNVSGTINVGTITIQP